MAQVADRPAKYIGADLPRVEDREFVTGRARYTDDITLPGMVWMAFVRSPHAHARINGVDFSEALRMPGVIAAYTGADLAGDWIGPLPMAWNVSEDLKNPPHWPISPDVARYHGDPVAVVVAETRAQARDAAELVRVDYEPLPVVTGIEEALADGAPLVHDDLESNQCYTWSLTNGDIDKVFAEAPVVVKERYLIQRAVPNPIEPRSVLADANPATGELTLWTSSQIPHIVRTTLAAFVLGVPEQKLRVIAPRVGGAFGSKLQVYGEEALSLALARKLSRPVKWTEDRSEHFLATHHGREQVQEMEVAADEDGRIRGWRARIGVNMGAYLMIITPGTPLLGAFLYCGAYGGEAYHVEFKGVFTNTTPTDAYRGAGRPEATYAVERIMDALARRLGADPVEIRRINFLPPFTEPTQSIGGLMVDSGNYHETLDHALQLAGYEELRKEQAARRERGDVKQLGIGFSTYLEMCGLAPSRVLASLNYAAGGWEAATVRLTATGKVEVGIGTMPHGQGHETTFGQIVADDLGVAIEDIEFTFGDTALVSRGMDSYGSRSIAIGGVAVHRACGKIVEKAKKIAAHELEVAEEDLEFEAGTFSVKGVPDRAKAIGDLAFSAWTAHNLPDGMEPGLDAMAVYDPDNFVFPYGAHICVVEVDMETGDTRAVKYIAVDDVGTVINPLVVDGQIHGGVVQGIAEALYEEGVYGEDGTLLTGSLTNYLVPSATEVPDITVGREVTPSTSNELGVKGVGETGTIASPPAVINAVIDALSHLGVTDVPRPASPENIWRTIQQARGGAR